MKATLRYFIVLAVCLIPFTYLGEIKDRFLIQLGILFGVSAAYWISYALIKKKQGEQRNDKDSK